MATIDDDTGVTQRKLQDVRARIALAEAEISRLYAEERSVSLACPHVDKYGRPTTRRSWSDTGKGWCDVCSRGFTLDGDRVVGPW